MSRDNRVPLANGGIDARVDAVIDQLTLDEQVSLLAGTDFWHTAAIERLGVPAMRVSDGPSGARGTLFEGGPQSVNVPCGTSLAATWDPSLVEEVGALLGREARAKGARVLLAPTVNLHRTPVGGRNFECMSEDPHLTARTAVGYVRGLQGEGVGACIKHFVGNDTEFERNTIDSRIDERSLRELYLVPFEAAVKETDVLAVMTAYNHINGPWSADSPLVNDVLRGEWGFDGLVMSDWFGLHSTAPGVIAGLDLEMPGPTIHRGEKLLAAVERGEVTREAIRAAARNVLRLVARSGAWDDGAPATEGTRDLPEDRVLVRRAGARSMVLLRNEPGRSGPVLPLQPAGLRRVAVIGPNAANGQTEGGGSAHVPPTHVVQPLDALRGRFSAAGVEVTHAVGCLTHQRLPGFDPARCTPFVLDAWTDVEGAFTPGAVPDRTTEEPSTRWLWMNDPIDTGAGSSSAGFSVRLRTTLTPDVSGAWQFGLGSIADAYLTVDGVALMDNVDAQPGGSFFGIGKAEKIGSIVLEAGRGYDLEVRLRRPASDHALSGLFVGALAPELADPVAAAVDIAAAADLAIVIVGTNAEWESEGYDRDDIALPGRQDELVARVAAACPNTVVVVNAGSPVSMPWLDDVNAVVVTWFPGQELGDALADVLFGDVEPQGRLPVSFPRRLEDTPAFEHHPGRNGVAQYVERRLVGYRWYDTVGREPLFPFGFGLGYAHVSVASASVVDPHQVHVELVNGSQRDGVSVVQVYAHRVERGGLEPDEPQQVLVGFARAEVPAGERATVAVTLDPRAYHRWSVDRHDWVDDGARYELRVGTSSRHIAARLAVAR